VLLPVVGVCLLGALATVLIMWFLRPPKMDLIAIAVADYTNPEVPPIAYCYEDLEALRAVLDPESSERSSWNDATTDKIAQLDTALRETSNSHDNVLVYIKAHGVSLNGAPYLLDASFALRGRSGRLSIDKLLESVAESPARIKLLVLDTGHLESDPRMGMLANEFTHLVVKAVARRPASDNVWVLTSNSLFERAQVSLKDQRSAFCYYLAEGLKGAADGVLSDVESDGLVQLDELFTYVREHTVQYARLISSDRQSQTPTLLRSGEGEVSAPPHEDLLRIEAAPEAEETNVARQRATQRRDGVLPLSPSATLAMALVGNQQTSATGDDAPKEAEGKTAPPPDPATAAKADGKKAAVDAAAAPSDAPAADKSASAAKDENAKSAVKEAAKTTPAEGAKKGAAEVAAKPQPRRSRIEEMDIWLDTQQKQGELWRPTDYAPSLTRLYYESLRGCRQRALAGELFLTARAYRSSLSNKLDEVLQLQRRINEQEAEFVRGAARPSYERDDDVNSVIRLRNDAFYLLPLLVEHHALAGGKTQPKLQGELHGLIAAAFELDRLLAREYAPRDPAQAVESWKRELTSTAARIRAHLETLRGEFEARSEEQKRLVKAKGNQAVTPRLADLAESPLASPEEREELQSLATKAAQSFAEVEKQGSAALRRPSTTDRGRLSGLGWQRVIDRAELELELLAEIQNKEDEARENLDKTLSSAAGLTTAEARMGLVRKIDRYMAETYGNMPNTLRELLKSSDYGSWRRAETMIRLADARDQRRIDKVLDELPAGEWSDPVADVPLKALPEQVTRRQLALGNGPGSLASPIALHYKVPQKLAVRFESNEVLQPDQLRLKLEYDATRVQIKNAQGTALAPGRIWGAAAAGARPAREQRIEIELASLDDRGQRTDLTVIWIDEDDRELARGTAALVHPEPKFSQLAVYGQPGTADHYWETASGGSYFDAPFQEGLAHVRLTPFAGHDTRYDFKLTNTATHPKKYAAVVYSIPQPGEREAERDAASLAMVGEKLGKELARNELLLEPGATRSIPFFPAKPSTDPKEAAAPPAPAAAANKKPGEAAKEPAPDISSGMVCVLTEDSAGGNAAGESRRQVIVIEIDPQPPSNYITPRVNYDARTGEIAAVLSAPDPNGLPPGGAEVRMEVITQQKVRQPSSAKDKTVLTAQNPDDTLRVFAPAGTPARAEVFLHVDGYPRAFIYELALDASLPNVERTLLDLHRIALPDPASFRVYYPGKVDEAVRFPFSVDMPPSANRRYLARLFIDPQPGGAFNPDEDKVLQQSFQDRDRRATLVKPESGTAIAVQTKVSDFLEMLDLSPYLNEVHVRAQLVRLEQGREEVLGDADQPADKEIVLYLDGEAPTVSARGPTRAVDPNQKFRVDVYARDQVTEVDKVEYAIKVQPKPESPDPDERILVEPKPVPRQPNGVYQLIHAFEAPGEHELWFQATDKSGNKSPPEKVLVTVRKPVTADPGGQPAPPQPGQIVGRAVLPDGARGDITKVVLTDAQGQVVDEQSNLSDGQFRFDNVKPGQYTLEAHGTVSGNFGKPVPIKVVVESGKRTSSIRVPLGR
jgi:hypothetical protein